MTIANNIKTIISQIESAKEYLRFVEEHFRSADKSLVDTLMTQLTTMKFDGLRSMQEHMMAIAHQSKLQFIILNHPTSVVSGANQVYLRDYLIFTLSRLDKKG